MITKRNSVFLGCGISKFHWDHAIGVFNIRVMGLSYRPHIYSHHLYLTLNFYAAGFPCQPYSIERCNCGWDNERRALLFGQMIERLAILVLALSPSRTCATSEEHRHFCIPRCSMVLEKGTPIEIYPKNDPVL